jgi:hypothetical protein
VAEPPSLDITFDQTPVFTLQFSDTWMYQIGEGLIVFGEASSVFKGLPGPSISVNRPGASFALTLDGLTLANAMDTYLRRGPLRGDHFAMLDEVTSIAFDGREALSVTVEGREVDVEDEPLMRVYIVATQANNGEYYFISASTLAERWDQDWPLMEAMLATVDIRE